MPDPRSTTLELPPVPYEVLTAEEVAALCGFTLGSLYVNRFRNLSPGNLAIKWQNRLYWRRSDVEAWLNERLTGAFDEAWKRRNDPKPVAPVTHARELLDKKKAGDE